MILRRAAAIALSLALLSGCTGSGDLDGDLVDDWRSFEAPVVFTPPAGICHLTGYKDSNMELAESFRPVDCASEHGSETLFVGQFTGEVAAQASPPPDASPAHRAAFAECDKRAAAFVGDEWREAHLAVGVVMPSRAGWRGGARWFRCDLTEVNSDLEVVGEIIAYGTGEPRTGSLKDALRGASDLRLGCYQYNDSDSSRPAITVVGCDRRHNTEFAGVLRADGSMLYPAGTSAWNRLYEGCRKVIAAFAKVPYDGNIAYRTGVFAQPAPERYWKAGDHGVRCFLWLGDRMVSRSLQGAGTKGLPM